MHTVQSSPSDSTNFDRFNTQTFNTVSQPFPPTALRRRHAQTVRDSTSSYKIDYVIVIKNFLNPEGHQNPISGSKVTAILQKGLILPIGGASSGRVCVCSLRNRLVWGEGGGLSREFFMPPIMLYTLELPQPLHVPLLVVNCADDRRQTDRHKDGQTDRQTDRQRDIHTDRQTD